MELGTLIKKEEIIVASSKVSKSFADFLNALESQYRFLSKGGTSYRVETAALSLLVAKKVLKLHPFLNLRTTRTVVKRYLTNANEERVDDVTKMLYLNARQQSRRARDLPEFKAAVDKRMKNRKALRLVKQ